MLLQTIHLKIPTFDTIKYNFSLTYRKANLIGIQNKKFWDREPQNASFPPTLGKGPDLYKNLNITSVTPKILRSLSLLGLLFLMNQIIQSQKLFHRWRTFAHEHKRLFKVVLKKIDGVLRCQSGSRFFFKLNIMYSQFMTIFIQVQLEFHNSFSEPQIPLHH